MTTVPVEICHQWYRRWQIYRRALDTGGKFATTVVDTDDKNICSWSRWHRWHLPLVHLYLWIYLQILEKNFNHPNVIFRGLVIHEKPEAKISWHGPLKSQRTTNLVTLRPSEQSCTLLSYTAYCWLIRCWTVTGIPFTLLSFTASVFWACRKMANLLYILEQKDHDYHFFIHRFCGKSSRTTRKN